MKAIGTTNSQPVADNTSATNTAIVINDRLTYTSVRDFQSPTAANHYREWLKARERQAAIETDLEKSRERYARSNEDGRRLLREVILHNEAQLLLLNDAIRSLEKQIRNEENNK